jgi:hypothetical protein
MLPNLLFSIMHSSPTAHFGFKATQFFLHLLKFVWERSHQIHVGFEIDG